MSCRCAVIFSAARNSPRVHPLFAEKKEFFLAGLQPKKAYPRALFPLRDSRPLQFLFYTGRVTDGVETLSHFGVIGVCDSLAAAILF